MSNLEERNERLQIVETSESTEVKEAEPSASGMSGDRPQKRSGRRAGRRSVKMDVRAKLERSRQSARECRARKKLRYQYLEDLVANREKAVFALRDELEMYKEWCAQLDIGLIPLTLLKITEEIDKSETANQNEDKLQESTNQRSSSTQDLVSNGHTSSSEFTRGNNSDTNSSESDGDDNDDDCYIEDHDEAGSSADGDSWEFVVDDGYVKVVPTTKYSSTSVTNTLPTILEDKEC